MSSGGKRQGAGRKPGSIKPRTILKQQRWTDAEWEEILRLSAIEKLTPSEYIRWKALKQVWSKG